MSYVKNTAYVGVSKFVENIISYFIIVMISRSLGASGLGQYSFIFSFVGLFFIFSDFGLVPLMIKDLSKDFSKVDKYVSNIFSLKVILSVVSFIIYFIALFFINRDDVFFGLVLAGIVQLISVFSEIFISLLRIKNNSKILGFSNILERLIALLGGFISIFVFKSLFLFISFLVFSNLFKLIFLYLNSKKYFKFKFSFHWSFLLNLLKNGWPFVLIFAFSMVYIQIDSIMLYFLKGETVVGWYNSAYKLINILNIFPMLLMVFGFPQFSRLFHSSKEKLKTFFSTTIYYCNLIIFPIVVGVWLVGDRVLEFIYDFGSPESFIVFKILIIAQIFIFLTTVMGKLIAATGKQIVFMNIAGTGAFINIILNFILIPKYSLYGAGIATGITYFLMFIIMCAYIMKNYFTFKLNLFFPFFGSFVMFLIIKQILYLHIFFIIVLGGLSYLITVLLLDKNLRKSFI